MIEFYFFGTRVKVHFLFVALGTLFLLLDKTGIGFLSIVCSLLHEMGHIVFVVIFCKAPQELAFEITGIRLIKKDLTYAQEIVVLLAGSMTNFILAGTTFLLTHDVANMFFAINITIGIVNFLPVNGFDGGKALKIFLNHIFSLTTSEVIFSFIEVSFILSIIILSAYFFTQGIVNISVLILCVYLVLAC